MKFLQKVEAKGLRMVMPLDPKREAYLDKVDKYIRVSVLKDLKKFVAKSIPGQAVTIKKMLEALEFVTKEIGAIHAEN